MAGALIYAAPGFKAVICSSTLIAPDVVLLAAHCVDPNALGSLGYSGGTSYWSPEPDLGIYDGSGDPPLPDDAVLLKASVFPVEFDINQMQDGTALNYDIALAFLDEPLEDQPLGVVPTADEAEALTAGQRSRSSDGARRARRARGVKYWASRSSAPSPTTSSRSVRTRTTCASVTATSGGPTFLAVETGSATKERVVG
jgi:hypothetical protein